MSAARPRLAAVVGWPIAHSLSPVIHRHWADREGVNAHYIPVAAADGDAFQRVVGALRTLGFAGCNVTHPYKEHALRLADDASPTARRAGAANMLTFVGDRVFADNSDVAGFADSLREHQISMGSRVVLLGAGGAARAALLALEALGARDVAVVNRDPARAQQAARLIGAAVRPWSDRSTALDGASLLVNATSLGMSGGAPLDIDLARLPAGAAVVDMVYVPLETALLAAARAQGARAIDGLSMLMHQAAYGYRAWLGEAAPVSPDLRARLLEALSARGRV